ncbi:aldehyde dehydrogenase family protein [Dietzia sp.]|uniref:aldehyde dehydrogenase family protein n=1 Tax=Dietzia sp. TaxID=1871616 RepID=UPI002FDB7088
MNFFPDDTSSLYIDGELRPGSGGTYPVSNPATGKEIGLAANGTPEDADLAVAAARRAFDDQAEGAWSQDPAMRARLLRALHSELTARIEEIRELTIAEVGTSYTMTTGAQMQDPIDGLLYWADLAENFTYSEDKGEAELMGIRSRHEVRREGAGVVAAITPWNFPHQINFAKVGAALAAGCTVVLKPAPDTPWTGALLGPAAQAAGFPSGVLNIVTSESNDPGERLVEHPDVDVVSFTGSSATGRKIMASAAPTLKKVFLELGGKSAAIVLDDADLAAACMMTAITCTLHAGQGCVFTTRLVVPRQKLDEAIAVTSDVMAGIVPGDPHDPATMCGPIINQRQLDRVSGYVDLARSEGATIEFGGEPFPSPTGGGYWYTPTLISGLDEHSRVAQEEIFGPVLAILPHDGDDDAVRIANDNPYGLSGAVWGTDPERLERAIRGMRTGTLSINGGQYFGQDMPFGGVKQSGIGREMGEAGFEEFLEYKSIGYGT